MNNKQRIERLEQIFSRNDWIKTDTAVFTYRDGHTESLFWIDAVDSVLSGEIVDVEGGEQSNLIGLLQALMEGNDNEQ